MSDREVSMALYSVGATWKAIGAGGAVTEVGGAVTRAVRVTTGAAGTRAMIVGEGVPLAVTSVLVRLVLEPPP